jgi:methionine-rich copper-binding protein CopC
VRRTPGFADAIEPASVHFLAMLHRNRTSRGLACLAIGALLVLLLPAAVAAHADLETSTPADGATVPSPFDEPIVMTFSAALADGSKADLLGPGGATVASAIVDGPGATMTITLDAALAPGDYEVKWVSVGEDGDLERDTFSFAVAAPPPTASPSPSPTIAPPAASPTETAESAAPSSPPPSSAAPSAMPSAAPSSPLPSSAAPVEGDASSGAGDVLLPIIATLVVVGAGAVYLLSRRNRPTLPR